MDGPCGPTAPGPPAPASEEDPTATAAAEDPSSTLAPVADTLPYVCASFYRFAALGDLEAVQQRLRGFGAGGAVLGTILLAAEGINAQVAGLAPDVAAFVAAVREFSPLADVEPKLSRAATQPFYRLKVSIKPEIIKLGVPTDLTAIGGYVTPREWHAALAAPGVLVLDTRNADEVALGTFRGAVNPRTRTFTEFPRFVDTDMVGMEDRPIAMFCTGGIRCEKAAAYLRRRGFRDVRQLHGGVLKYFEEVPPEESQWEGELFVFDGRLAVRHGQSGPERGTFRRCFACRASLSPADQASPLYECGVSCPHCHGTKSAPQEQAVRMRQLQVELGQRRAGVATAHAHIGHLAPLLLPRGPPPAAPTDCEG